MDTVTEIVHLCYIFAKLVMVIVYDYEKGDEQDMF